MIKTTYVDQLDMKPAAPFKTLEEERAYWQTHSIVDGLPADAIVSVRRSNKKTISLRLDEDDITELQERAREQGIGPTTLARMLLHQELRRRPHAGQ